MTAHIGHPTLRLVRYAIGEWTLDNIANGEFILVKQTATKATIATTNKKETGEKQSNSAHKAQKVGNKLSISAKPQRKSRK